MNPILDVEVILREELENFASEEERQLALTVGKDLATLYARQLLGEDVKTELGLAIAAALTLSATAQRRVGDALLRFFKQALDVFVRIALPAAIV